MADSAEIKLSFRIDPLQELDKKLRERIEKDYRVKLAAIEVKETVRPSKPRWDARKIEQAARAFVKYDLAIIATVANDLDKEVGKAANDRDRDKAIKDLAKRLQASYKTRVKEIRDKLAEGFEELESDKNPDEEKALKLAGKSLSDVASVQIQSAVLDLRGSFEKTLAALMSKLERLSKGLDAEESYDDGKSGGKNVDKGPLAAQRAKLISETVKSLKSASDEFDGSFKDARAELEDMVDILKLGARKKDVGEAVTAQMEKSAKDLGSQIDRVIKTFRDTKPARDKAIRLAISSGEIKIDKVMAELPARGGALWKAAESMAKTISSHKKEVEKLQKAAKK